MRSTKRTALTLAVIAVIGLSAPAAVSGNGEIVSVAGKDFASAGLGGRGFDRLMEKDGRVYLIVSPGEMAALTALRVAFAVETPRLKQASAQGLSADGGVNGAYHSTIELETDMRILERDHPGLASVHEIGETLEKRKILALKISDNAAAEEHEPAVLFVGCHHAREWISVEVPFLFGRYLVENYDRIQEVRELVDAGEIWIVPAANPDGLEYSIHVYRYWRKNRRANPDGTFGVDLNRNYGYAWGFDDIGSSGQPGSDVYRGAGPFSEPESAAVRGLFTSHDFRALVSFHSYAQVILYPWGFTTEAAPTGTELESLAAAMAGLMEVVNGTVYRHGQASRGLYLTNGDTVDWAYSVAGAPSFTIELPPVDIDHGGFFNDEAAIGSIFEENLPAMLYLTRYAVDHPLPARPRLLLPRRRVRPAASSPRTIKLTGRPAPGR
jgi:carboxypeptidase T